MMNARHEQRLLAIALLAGFVLFLASARISEPFVGNQNTYYPHGLRAGGVEFLEADWFANTRPPHRVFSLAVAAAVRAGMLEATIPWARAALQAMLLAGLAAFVLRAARQRPGASRVAFAASPGGVACLLLVALGIRRIGLPEALHPGPPGTGPAAIEIARDLLRLSGVAGQTIVSDALEPASLGALALLGLGAFWLGAWRTGAVACALAALGHPTYLPHGAVAVACTCAMLWRQGARAAAWQSALVFGALAAPAAFDALRFAAAATPEALRILATERIPHHALPRHWFDAGDALRLLLIGVAGVRLQRAAPGAHSAAFVGLAVVAVAGLLAVVATDSLRLALVFPWRSTVLLFPIACVVLLHATVGRAIDSGLARLARRTQRDPASVRAAAAAFLAATVAIASVGAGGAGPAFRAFPPIDAFADRVRESTPADARVLVPARLPFQGFRLRARRAIYVDSKSHPYLAEELVEWRRRVQWARGFEKLDGPQRLRACRLAGVTHYVVPQASLGVGERALVVGGGHALVACP